ncbi:small ribosomal subunit protein mS39 [Anabrus simplex]|uniref:small ribosomal subunit protein mS39 n=1 Tax=Anabrus simplex TaxID=316456 RepID=UPI0034DCD818
MNSINKLRFGWRSTKSVIGSITAKQSSSEAKKDIVIPYRIERGPTDILRALAGTVQRDTTAAHYKYHDDPFLIPMSNTGKRTFALAKESGRKAANWIRNQHPELFQHQEADPPIKDFMPQAIYDENSDVAEETLRSLINSAAVSDAITVYQLLEKQEKPVSQDTRQQLLELLCFYNCEDSLPEEWIEERWFRQGTRGNTKRRKTWKDNGLAEAIFQSLEPKEPAAYCALIQGMANYCQVDRAWELYQETQDKGIPLLTETYNSLLRGVNFLRESADLQWKLIQDLLSAIAKQGLKPNLGTLNAALEVISTMNQRQAKQYSLRILAEFRKIGIEPSLATYYYLLITFCKERGPVSNILLEIMNHIDGQHFTIQDPKDTFFFVTAMDVCRNHLQDVDLAYRVDALLHAGNNYNLIGDSYKESIYYRHFFVLLCSTEPLDVFMKMYNKLVPHIYIPEPSVMEEVVRAVDLNGAVEYFPRLWSDMVTFDHTDRENLVTGLLDCMVRNRPPAGSELETQFGKVAWDVWNKLEDVQEGRYRQIGWSGAMLGDVLILTVRAGNFSEACQVVNKLVKSQHTIAGLPKVEALQCFLDACIAQKSVPRAITCIEFSADVGFPEAGKMAQKLRDELPLDSAALAKLTNIVGKEVLQTKEEPATVSSA